MHSTNQTNRTNKNSCIANTRPFQLTGWLTWANQNTRGHLQHILRQNTHIWTHLLLHSHIPQGRGVPWASDPAQYLAHVGWKVPPKRLCVCVCVCVCLFVCLCQPLPCLSACSMFPAHRQGNGKGRERRGRDWRGVWSWSRDERGGMGRGGEFRCGSHKRLGRNSLGYKGKWADRGLTPTNLMRGHIWAASQEKQIRLFLLTHTQGHIMCIKYACMCRCVELFFYIKLWYETSCLSKHTHVCDLSTHRHGRHAHMLMYTPHAAIQESLCNQNSRQIASEN